MSRPLRADQVALVWASVVTVALWALPYIGLLALPVLYLNTHVHELGHALAAWATGGVVHSIRVFGDGSGLTMATGGSALITGSAGYLGATLGGTLVMLNMGSAPRARTALKSLGAAIALSMALYVRGDMAGIFSGIGWIALLWLAAHRLPDRGVLFAAGFLGVQQCLNSLGSLMDLLHISAAGQGHSDARILESHTGVPALLWASGWAGLSLLLVYGAAKAAWRGR